MYVCMECDSLRLIGILIDRSWDVCPAQRLRTGEIQSSQSVQTVFIGPVTQRYDADGPVRLRVSDRQTKMSFKTRQQCSWRWTSCLVVFPQKGVKIVKHSQVCPNDSAERRLLTGTCSAALISHNLISDTFPQTSREPCCPTETHESAVLRLLSLAGVGSIKQQRILKVRPCCSNGCEFGRSVSAASSLITSVIASALSHIPRDH